MFRYFDDCVRTPLALEKGEISKELVSYCCDMCELDTKWISETDVELHKRIDHADLIRDLIDNSQEKFCTICVTQFDSYSQLLSHTKTVHLFSSPEAKRIEHDISICDYCQTIFFNKNLLEIHMMYVHCYPLSDPSRCRLTSCPKCRKIIKLRAVWHHFQIHEIPSVNYCDICLTSLPSKVELLNHLKTHKKFLKCEPCNYLSYKQSTYEEHLKRHEERPVTKHPYLSKALKHSFLKMGGGPKSFIHNSLKGLIIPNWLKICVLCRHICTDKIEMINHVLKIHLYKEELVKKINLCTCGEAFFNKVLLRQHILKLGEGHKVVEALADTSLVSKKSQSVVESEEMIRVIELAEEDVPAHTTVASFERQSGEGNEVSISVVQLAEGENRTDKNMDVDVILGL